MGQPVNTLQPLAINGTVQWVSVRSADDTLPVLLVLHGGPGYAMLPLMHAHNRALEDHFVVVNWDQRGAGRSYSRETPGVTMSLDGFLDDLRDLTALLRARFRRPKVYLMGHSWGSLLGLRAVERFPGDYEAFVGVGQVVNVIRNEIVMYDWTLSQARESGAPDAVRQLEAIGRPDGRGVYPRGGGRAYDTAERWMSYFGGDLRGHRSTEVIEDWLLSRPEYRGRWGKKWRDGLDFSGRIFDDPEVWNTDFPATLTRVEVPVFFFTGVHDRDTPHELVAGYYPNLEAPRKGLILFEKSAHFPFYEEPELFNRRLIAIKDGIDPGFVPG